MRSLIAAAVILLATPQQVLAEQPREVELGGASFTLGESKKAITQRCPIVESLPTPAKGSPNVCGLSPGGDETFAVISGPVEHPRISGILKFKDDHLTVICRNQETIDVDDKTGKALQGFLELLGSRIAHGEATAEVEYTKSDDSEIQGQSVLITIKGSGVNLVLSTGMPGHKGLQLEIREAFVATPKP